jgi:hypothetical protein
MSPSILLVSCRSLAMQCKHPQKSVMAPALSGACANAGHSLRWACKIFRWFAFKPNGKVLIRGLAKRSSQRATNLGSRSYAANNATTAAMARSADKLLSGDWIPANHTRTSRYGRFMIPV